MAATTARSTPAAAENLLRLHLWLSPARRSKVIAKQLQGGAFRCCTCGRAFATFQALGGHRTSHKRPMVRAHGLDLLLGAQPGKGGDPTNVHRCSSCGVVFPTGQALGGHMRRHRAPAAVGSIKFVALSDDQEAGGVDSIKDNRAAGHLLPTATLIKFI